ncbi:hypothetical protein [Actinomadura rupiterrae]|uniref:hypothetical protein n=1 Tax=Actinomadura rupiterrae TaxID=559627 RepID=UPI0020A273EC|nr:hypothetical protein [Actinomadura rupiterrae]MCP2337841.1 hypothetical protein [Actinomadura rupiterrae]
MTTPTRQPAVPSTAAAPAKRSARPLERQRGRLVTLVRGRWLKTVPGRIRGWTALAVLAIAALALALTLSIQDARQGVQTIGHDAGPQVVATGNLYFALSDMDAQIADILLIGREKSLGIGFEESMRRYERARSDAGSAAVQAAQLAGKDQDRRQTVQEVIDGLGQYQRLVGQALTLNEQAQHPAGELPQPVIDTYRQASDLMKLELLPKAYNLTLDSGATVRQSYQEKRTSVLDGRYWVLAAGLVVLVVLAAGQLAMAREFRRLLNPGLALATAATIILVAVGVGVLNAQAGHLLRAKRDGFDSVLTLSRVRAISHSSFADESRYLLDPGRADTYEQNYLDKVSAILWVDPRSQPANLKTYYALAGKAATTYHPGDRSAFLGLLGDEARQARKGAESDALARVLRAYAAVLDNDRTMRQFVQSGDRNRAIGFRMGRGSSAIRDFDAYDEAMRSLANTHSAAFDRAIRDADGGLSGWKVIPPVAAVVIAVLVLVGVRPRLAEFGRI